MAAAIGRVLDDDLCECDRPDESDNPHRHTFDVACVYWIAGRPGLAARQAAVDRLLPLTGGSEGDDDA